jgi:pilus assembly protein TadC
VVGRPHRPDGPAMTPGWVAAAVLAAGAVAVGPGRIAAAVRLHALWPAPSTPDSRWRKWLVRKRKPAPDPLGLASGWDLLAACLRGGLPVPDAVRAVAAGMPGEAATALARTADLIALGADPATAWAPALDCPATAELARGARRTARSGAALAGVAEELAAEVRANAGELAEARAQRAGVAATGPLGLCFLPAFLCLGVAPVIVGLATRLFTTR